MRKPLFILTLLLSVSGGVDSQVINKVPLSPRITGYKIDAKLNPATKSIEGTMETFWVNQTNETVSDIQLHMYMNAFKSKNSTLYKEMSYPSGKDTTVYGYVDIK